MRDELVVALRGRGLDVSVVACYETQPIVPSDADRALLAAADVVFIGAPSAWSVARRFVAPDAWIVVPGATTGAVVAAQHERVLEGWGPSLRQRLAIVD
jgi:uroporphyrinogen-III synthase